jgi:hypothetical protein
MSNMPSPNDFPGNPMRYWVALGEWQRQRIVTLESKLHSCEATMKRDRDEQQAALAKWEADFKAQGFRLDSALARIEWFIAQLDIEQAATNAATDRLDSARDWAEAHAAPELRALLSGVVERQKPETSATAHVHAYRPSDLIPGEHVCSCGHYIAQSE